MKPPIHLSAEAKKWWRKVTSKWEIDESAFLLLEVSLEALDEMRVAQKTLKKEGAIIRGKNGVMKKSPALEFLKLSRSHFLQSWRMLGLQLEPPRENGRPTMKGLNYDEEESL